MGTPTIGVMALMGMVPTDVGSTLTSWHSKAVAAPASMVQGMSTLWLDEFSISRAMCGTTSPMKPIGPQKAVTVAVRMPDTSSRLLRVLRRFTPRLSAYRLPSNNALSGLTSNIDQPMAANSTDENKGRIPVVTPEKLPSPHIT